MPSPSKPNPRNPAPRESRPEPPPESRPANLAHGGEAGWLPDLVYTGETFEGGLAFFADRLGRITRFSRDPADVAAARRLPGQAALPGLVNGHASSWHRLLRGRAEKPSRDPADPRAPWREAVAAVAAKLSADDVYDAARMAFTEMLLSGTTCVGEFHHLACRPDGGAPPDATLAAEQVLRAAHDVGIRICLFSVVDRRDRAETGTAPSIDDALREAERLRTMIASRYPADEAWLGLAAADGSALPLEAFKALAAYGHAQRLRVQVPLAPGIGPAAALQDQPGRTPLAVLSEAGLVDKRFTAIHGSALTEDDCRVLGAARAAVCACPTAELDLALGLAPVDAMLRAGVSVALGTAGHTVDLLRAARDLEYALRRPTGRRPALGPDAAKTVFHAATVAGARSVGATGGALEVGRPADFFTINLYEPSIAGADAETLLAHAVFALERRAIREVWIGAKQRIANGRHPDQGAVVGRFVDLQRRRWSA